MTGEFEKKVLQNLLKCGIRTDDPSLVLGVAVSGGADSVSLLLCLKELFSPSRIRAITVNHNLREKDETEGDAAFVCSLCSSLGIKCKRVDIARGKIKTLAEKNSLSLEEAARIIRYHEFETFIQEESLSYLCTAHTLSDNSETLVMRFLQGSGSEGLRGIPLKREHFIRPLLTVSRDEVVSYLAQKNQAYRTDSTNCSSAYFRNRVRGQVVPLLNGVYPGWQNCVATLAKKMSDDDDALLEVALNFVSENVSFFESECSAKIEAKSFCALPDAVKRRVLFIVVDKLTPQSRVPFSFIENICALAGLSATDAQRRKCHTGTLEATFGQTCLVLKKREGVLTERGFSVILNGAGCASAGRYQFYAVEQDGRMILVEQNSGESVALYNVSFPLCIRSYMPGDSVKDAKKNERSVKGVFDGWKTSSKRQDIPLVQDLSKPEQPVVCIWGALMGFKNWIEAFDEK